MLTLQLVVVVTLSVGGVKGWFLDQYKGRELDGTLRCYQCDTTSKRPEDEEFSSLCSLQHWKHANVSEKRSMIMQCPRRKSAFCHLVVREEDPLYAVRGCHGPRYDNGKGPEAHTGCFYMDHPEPLRRGCLCDTMLCNGHPSLRRRPLLFFIPLLLLLTNWWNWH